MLRMFVRTFHRSGGGGGGGGACIYNVYCSQFEGCKDSFLLDEMFLALIE